MRLSHKLFGGILIGALLSFSAFRQAVKASDTLTTKATVGLLDGPEPDGPNDIWDPYDPDDPYPGDPADPDNKGTGSVGQLTLDYVSNLRFGSHEIRNGGLTATALNTHAMAQITDGRGNGAGWTLQLRPDYLVGEQTGSVIGDGYLYLGSIMIRKPSTNVSSAPNVKATRIPLGQWENIVTAPVNSGKSVWTIGFNQVESSPTTLVINDLSGLKADHYVGSLSWSLTNAPT
ncbi:WxL domain-containing protein [Companilactobacillus versmoldensis]|uniref:Extracellular protein n=1 Tax=Companilactobacillus versmoldensis DSM 14857 = KCTC 3814 TaxID=1423815 RepID=A0A0R1SNA8_9LACO|nr:WxL domain-containing protein [Companilactobacillus versmoldensis]KRL68186.1 extracellular protein [Companilactobacillus versmoldensis DSM 14857 = KCTC 3814]